jgi:integrase
MTKGTRRPNGTSSIYLGKDGDWHGRVTVGVKNDGRPDRRHVQRKTEAEVIKAVQVLERERDKGAVRKPGKAPTVSEWMTTYLTTIAARTLAPRSLDDYWSKTKNWIIPNIGRHRLDRLRPEHLDALYSKMAAAGKAGSHQLKVHRIISRALEIALRRGEVTRNVAKLVDAPTVKEDEIESFTVDEARRVLETAHKRRNGARWSVGLALGLRQGEALGLRWKYLLLDGQEVRVWWQLQRTKWRHGCDDPHECGMRVDRKGRTRHRLKPCPENCKRHQRACPPPCPPNCTEHASTCPQRKDGGLVFREPKGKSKRTIALPPELVPILKEHREWQDAERAAAGEAWQDHDLVFARPDGQPISPREDWDEWKEILTEAGVRDARLHDGRHTAGTLMIEQGVHIRTVMEVLGHSDLRLTQRYTHVASPAAKDAAARMGIALWGSG